MIPHFMRKTFAVLLAGGLMLITGLATSRLANTISPTLEVEYHNPALFRSGNDPLMQLYWLAPFVTALILLRVWNATKTLINSAFFMVRGVSFAFNYWMVTLPGMLMSYSSFPLSFGIVLTWTIAGLAQALVAGMVFARLQP